MHTELNATLSAYILIDTKTVHHRVHILRQTVHASHSLIATLLVLKSKPS